MEIWIFYLVSQFSCQEKNALVHERATRQPECPTWPVLCSYSSSLLSTYNTFIWLHFYDKCHTLSFCTNVFTKLTLYKQSISLRPQLTVVNWGLTWQDRGVSKTGCWSRILVIYANLMWTLKGLLVTCDLKLHRMVEYEFTVQLRHLWVCWPVNDICRCEL